MNIAKYFGDKIKAQLPDDPAKAQEILYKSLYLESFHERYIPDRRMPHAYRVLNGMSDKLTAYGIQHPESYAWTNIFAPVEILQNFDISCVSMECIASFLSGYYLEDELIDSAEAAGIASTLCSYHKNFIGAVDEGLLPMPAAAVTTSMVCDGNINTFRYMEQKHGLKPYIIDVPQIWSPETEQYVVGQLKEFIALLEHSTGRKYDEDRLKETLGHENRAKQYYLDFLEKRRTHYYPNTLTLLLYMLFATHLNIGTQWVEDYFRMMSEEIDRYPLSDDKRLLWIHLEPYAQETLRSYLNYGKKYSIAVDDFNLDYIEPLDVSHPLEALARKMILNIYNGSFTRKADFCVSLAKKYNCDAAVEFCHWGCKQSSGGVMLMKEKMQEAGIPMLILDGDALDRRNNHDGQVKTRFEAFLEVIDQDNAESAV
jgi:benzoyl-CoA reductase/2-hydroxyglutaryl-CoA dehydratase subunit BcrC/BadD/HgdB